MSYFVAIQVKAAWGEYPAREAPDTPPVHCCPYHGHPGGGTSTHSCLAGTTA